MNVILPGSEVDLDSILIHDSVLTDFNHTLGALYYKAHGSKLRTKVSPYIVRKIRYCFRPSVRNFLLTVNWLFYL